MDKIQPYIRVADAVWLAAATLHRRHTKRSSFTASEIRLEVARIAPALKASAISAHISSHVVANRKPNGGHYRMLIELPDGTRRLFRPGDAFDPDRNGKIKPRREQIPTEYHSLLTWYEQSYCAHDRTAEDPIRAMWGLGREIWRGTTADAYVESLRTDWKAE